MTQDADQRAELERLRGQLAAETGRADNLHAEIVRLKEAQAEERAGLEGDKLYLNQQIARMRPVVDAALAWCATDREPTAHDAYASLIDACARYSDAVDSPPSLTQADVPLRYISILTDHADGMAKSRAETPNRPNQQHQRMTAMSQSETAEGQERKHRELAAAYPDEYVVVRADHRPFKWSDLTGPQVRAVRAMISSHADDLRIDRESIADYHGFDAFEALDALLVELRAEADRRGDRMAQDVQQRTGLGSHDPSSNR